LYQTYTPAHYRRVVEAIAAVAPNVPISTGWRWKHGVLLQLSAETFTKSQWLQVLRAIGQNEASYHLSDLEYLIWWKTEDEE
jgi:hypothetical protein